MIRPAAGADVVVACSSSMTDCIAFDGAKHVTVAGMRTPMFSVGGLPHQGGVSVGRGGADDVTLRDVDAGYVWIGADHVNIIGGDYGPAVDATSKISEAGNCGDRSCPPEGVLIEGATFHDYRRFLHHQECLALWGSGDDGVIVRKSTFRNCAVYAISVSAEADQHLRNVLLESNRIRPATDVETSSQIAVSSHGGRVEDVVVRGNVVEGDDILVDAGLYGPAANIVVELNRVSESVHCFGPGVTCQNNALPATGS